MYDREIIKRLNGEQQVPRLDPEVAAGIVSIEENVPVSRVREIIADFQPRDMPELRRAVRTIKSFSGQSGE